MTKTLTRALARANTLSSKAGFGMVEILISVAVVVTILTAIAAGLSFSLKTSSELKFRGIALAKAQELMEAVRRERAIAGWDNFLAVTGGASGIYTFCFNNESDTLHETFNWTEVACTDTVSWEGNDYIRELIINTTTPNQVDLTVEVYWQGRDKKIQLMQALHKWH